MIKILKLNWKVYLMEAVCLGLFMISASLFATILEYPESHLRRAIPNSFFRLCMMGLAMGLTAIGITYSPMGKLSGAHMNPAITLSFLGLGKIKPADAFFYLVFQLAGGLIAVWAMVFVLGDPFKDGHVNYVVTAPGKLGNLSAFIAEVMMSFGMMIIVLNTSNHSRLSSYTGVIAGILVMNYVIVSAPISGFSINPARTIASAIPSGMYNSFWIYMTAPFLGMFAAAAIYKAVGAKTYCAKINHVDQYLCIFNCCYDKKSTVDGRRSTVQ
jgi:aquaporin Z